MKSDSVHCQDENDFKTVVTWQSKFKNLFYCQMTRKRKRERDRKTNVCLVSLKFAASISNEDEISFGSRLCDYFLNVAQIEMFR